MPRHLFLLLLVVSGTPAILAQTTTNHPARGSASSDSTDNHDQESPQREMLRAMEIKREERDYKQHVARAKENAQLGVELNEAFSRQHSLQPADIKKLNRMEKLSRQIRSDAGGEDTKDELKDPPLMCDAALKQLVELSEELHKKVANTPRQVISAEIIKRAQKIIELIKYIRELKQ